MSMKRPYRSFKEKDRADTARSYMWVAYGGEAESPCVFYRYASGRSTAEAAAIVDGFTGFLQADGYEAYDRLAKERQEFVLAGCGAHARRKFVDAKASAAKAGAAASKPSSPSCPGTKRLVCSGQSEHCRSWQSSKRGWKRRRFTCLSRRPSGRR